MITRALIVWFVFLVFAIINGALREGLLVRPFGTKMAHILSTINLSAVILAVGMAAGPWIGYQSSADAWAVGALWVSLTLAFEFLAGHYLFGKSWAILLDDYNVLQGRI